MFVGLDFAGGGPPDPFFSLGGIPYPPVRGPPNDSCLRAPKLEITALSGVNERGKSWATIPYQQLWILRTPPSTSNRFRTLLGFPSTIFPSLNIFLFETRLPAPFFRTLDFWIFFTPQEVIY